MNQLLQREPLRSSLPGLCALVVAIMLAGSLRVLNDSLGGTTGKVASLAMLGGLLVVPLAIYLARHRKSADPTTAVLILLATGSTLLVASYLYGVSFYVLFPADLLMWAETDYINDIVKFRVGYPIYSLETNNESYAYTPGSQLLTYFIASTVGLSTSLPAYRCIQLLYTIAAALIAARSCRLLVEIGFDQGSTRTPPPWTHTHHVALFSVLFLFATNSLTNPYVHNLHNDALAQLVSVTAYYLLIQYTRTRDRRVLIAMFFVPAIGFLVKQNLALWGGYYFIYLVFFDQSRSFKRIIAFGGIGFALLCGVIGACFLLWGDAFIYWVFYVLSHHKVVLSRSIQHVIAVHAYLIASFVGALLLLRGANFSRLLGLWLISLLIMLVATYTGGINFMRHHMGPASLIAGIWFVAGVMRFWPARGNGATPSFQLERWLRAGIATVTIALLAGSGLGILRTPKQTLNDDAYRYLAAIEQEFEGEDPKNVLLDLGSFVYLRSGTVMKDRASAISERGTSKSGDISFALKRIREQRYPKLLLHNYGTDNFWYDRGDWVQSSGISKALEEHYKVIRRIPAVAEPQTLWTRFYEYGLTEITVLVPKTAE